MLMAIAATTESSVLVNLIAATILLCASAGLVVAIWLTIDGSLKLTWMDSEFKSSALGRDGRIRLDEFSIRSNVHPAIAKLYLNSKARQFGGLRELDELGDPVYLFGQARRNFLKQQMALLEEQPTDRASK